MSETKPTEQQKKELRKSMEKIFPNLIKKEKTDDVEDNPFMSGDPVKDLQNMFGM